MSDAKHDLEQESRGVEGLTEVLRLQAEALSRISERMSGVRSGMPDSSAGKPLAGAHASEAHGAHLPVLASDPSQDRESLPVLNSFKKFLDDERRRARKRILWVLLGFTVAFSCVLAAIVWLNSERVDKLNSDIAQERSRSERARQAAERELRKVENKATQAAAQTAVTAKKDITRNILWAHSVISSNVSSELAGRDEDLDRLKRKISAVEIENTMLTRRLNELARRMETVEAEYREFLERPMVEAQAPELVVPVITNPVALPPQAPSPLTINSAHFGRALRLQVPNE